MLGLASWIYTVPWNLARLPAASAPFGQVGLQLIGPDGLLPLAAQVERLCGDGPGSGRTCDRRMKSGCAGCTERQDATGAERTAPQLVSAPCGGRGARR